MFNVKKARIGVRVNDKTRDLLEDFAKKDKRTLSNLVTKILEDWVTEQSERQKTEEKPSVIKRGA